MVFCRCFGFFMFGSELSLYLIYCDCLPDFRVSGLITYPLDELLLTALCGSIGGAEDWSKIVILGRTHLDFLRQILAFTHGIASKRNFINVFKILDYN